MERFKISPITFLVISQEHLIKQTFFFQKILKTIILSPDVRGNKSQNRVRKNP